VPVVGAPGQQSGAASVAAPDLFCAAPRVGVARRRRGFSNHG